MFCFFYCNQSISQIREKLLPSQIALEKKNVERFKLSHILKNEKYDSAILINYKSGVYYIGKYAQDSIEIIQFLVVDKINNLKRRKIIYQAIKQELVYYGKIDSSLINKDIFDSLYLLGTNSNLNNSKIKVSTITPNSDINHLIFSNYKKGKKIDEFTINFFFMNDPKLLISGWQLKRLILQLYLNANHWGKVDKIIKEQGKGYYVLNNFIENNTIYFYDGKKTFTEPLSKRVWKDYFPTQFVKPSQPKPNNNYPLLPVLPKGAMWIDWL